MSRLNHGHQNVKAGTLSTVSECSMKFIVKKSLETRYINRNGLT